MTITDIKIKDNPEIVSSSIKLMHNDSKRQYALDMEFDTKKALKNVKVKVNIEMRMKFLENQYFSQTMDICHFLKNHGTNWQTKFIIGDLNQYPGLPNECPINSSFYYAKNLTSDLNFIPMKIIPETKFLATFDVFTYIKKRSVPVSLYKFEGSLKPQ